MISHKQKYNKGILPVAKGGPARDQITRLFFLFSSFKFLKSPLVSHQPRARARVPNRSAKAKHPSPKIRARGEGGLTACFILPLKCTAVPSGGLGKRRPPEASRAPLQTTQHQMCQPTSTTNTIISLFRQRRRFLSLDHQPPMRAKPCLKTNLAPTYR